MEVMSASSVDGFVHHGNSYYWFLRQLTWVLLALPVALVASRLPHRVLRAFAWPALLLAVVLLALTQTSLGITVNGNQNWLALGPLVIQPAEIGKLSAILWCSHIYARKERLLARLAAHPGPGGPGDGAVRRPGPLRRRPRHRPGADGDHPRACSGWSAPRPGCSSGRSSIVGVFALYLATTSAERLQRLTNFADPFKDYQGAGWQSAHGLFAMSSGGLFGKGIGASQQKWGSLPEAHTDFIFAVLGEELGMVGTVLVLGLFLTIAYAGIRVATRTKDPFVRYMSAGITIWLTAQMMLNVGMVLALLPVIGHAAAAGVLRRIRAAALAGGARPAGLLRPLRARGEGRAAGPPPPALRPGSPPVAGCRGVRDEDPAGRWGHRGAHLAAARHRRRPAPARPRGRDHRARHPAGHRGARGARGGLPAGADPAGAAAPRSRRPTCSACPAGCGAP